MEDYGEQDNTAFKSGEAHFEYQPANVRVKICCVCVGSGIIKSVSQTELKGVLVTSPQLSFSNRKRKLNEKKSTWFVLYSNVMVLAGSEEKFL